MGSLGDDVKKQLGEIDNALVKMDDFFGNLEEVDYEDLQNSMSPVDRAKYNITIAYAVNSLFWIYMRSFGEDPNNHKIKEELERIRGQMDRIKQISDKSKRPQVDKGAAERMVRHGINHHAKNRKRKNVDEENWDNEQQESNPDSTAASTGASAEKKSR